MTDWRIMRSLVSRSPPESLSSSVSRVLTDLGVFTALDLGACTLLCGGKQIRLSAREFDVMRFLLQSQSSILSKEVILARVWGYDSEAVENHVEVYVGFLRKKLRSIGSNIRIEAVRRLGYRLEVDEEC